MPLECNHYKKCVYGRLCTPDFAQSTALSIVQDATALLVPVTAVPTGPTAALINTNTVRKMLIWITVPL